VPPVDLAQTMPASAFNAVPPADNYSAPAETRLPSEGFSPPSGQPAFQQAPPTFDSQPRQAPPKRDVVQPQMQPAKKKSKGLLFGILGALFGLVILAAAGGGIAWYMMNQPATSGVTNTATPTPEPTATPSPEPTPEQAVANTDNGNTSNSDVSNTNTNVNSAVNSAPSPAPTRSVTQQTPVTQPSVRTVNTPRPSTPKPATPKPETKPTLRGTSIPQ
jgi:cytoskeletal protein RodZ